MVKMIRDTTGRFTMRPYYQASELDQACECLIRDLLLQRSGKVGYPVSTDDLTVLIEMHDADLDPYADLTRYGDDVEGVTEFFAHCGPKVSISERISGDDRRENRYRTTLTHEFGHVKFHRWLWDEKFATGDLLETWTDANKAISRRDGVLNAPQGDWMEWQAGYISGALLPGRRLVARVTPKPEVADFCAALWPDFAPPLTGHEIVALEDVVDHEDGLAVHPEILSARLRNGQSRKGPVWVSGDGGVLLVHGKWHVFAGPKQKTAVRVLAEAYLDGDAILPVTRVLTEAECGNSVRRLKDLFSGHRTWHEVITESGSSCWLEV